MTMVSQFRSGESVRARLGIYRAFNRLPALRPSYVRKFAIAALVGMMVPLASFVIYMMFSRWDIGELYPLFAATLLASVVGYLGTLWLLRELLNPIDLSAEAMQGYLNGRNLPDLPSDFPDQAGRLLEGTQYALDQLSETINRLERISDTDELTGLYNRRAGEKRLGEEVARAERDLESFQLAFFDVNEFKMVNDTSGHSAGDACLTHISAVLQLNTRRGDWVARWGGDEFIIGLHKNRAVKLVVDRIIHAIEDNPCELPNGRIIALTMSCGVAEYQFGSGQAGVLAAADRAMYMAKQEAMRTRRSAVVYLTHADLPESRPAKA
jgi:diguanylate cyclase (GGDEF)-like protein